MKRQVRGNYTVEAAGVMAAVLFAIMLVLGQAFHVHAQTKGSFALHEEVEKERHLVENIDEDEISRQGEGQRWSLQITSPVFRPENSLRLWGMLEGLQ
ncbi:MAG: hypothetical protein LUC99_12420 [Clostridiales bacterium]|nr:hypothetical protein [Clostridiales bacterium]